MNEFNQTGAQKSIFWRTAQFIGCGSTLLLCCHVSNKPNSLYFFYNIFQPFQAAHLNVSVLPR